MAGPGGVADRHFAADFAVGPEGGEVTLQALDFGGGEVAGTPITVPPRVGAPALNQKVPRPPVIVLRRE